jgi:hypothetical protein
MELPPGKTVESLFGGRDVLVNLLDSLNQHNLTGFVRTSLFRDDVRFEGMMVFHKGSAVMADHKSDSHLLGVDSIKEILRDSLDEDCVLEVHSYDYKSSMISVPHLAGNYPDAAVSDLPNMVSLLTEVESEERRRREEHLRELEEREVRADKATADLEVLQSQKIRFEQEQRKYQQQEGELRQLREEMQTVKDKSLELMRQISVQREKEQALSEAEKKLEQIKLSKEREELKDFGLRLQAKEKELLGKERELSGKETALAAIEEQRENEKQVINRERTELNNIWKELSNETGRISEARKLFEKRAEEAIHREKDLARIECTLENLKEKQES